MTQVGAAALLIRLDILRRGTARTPPTPAEAAARSPLRRLINWQLMRALAQQDNARVYRPDVLWLYAPCRWLRRAPAPSQRPPCASGRNRHENRQLASRSIGSTLLLKGLEAEVAVIPSPENMDARHLYVALTRGSTRIVVCSNTPELVPQQLRCKLSHFADIKLSP